jgi:tricorn protease-like protein
MKRTVRSALLTLLVTPLFGSCTDGGTEPDPGLDPDLTPLNGRGGGAIAFVSNRNGGDDEIFVMNADGGGARHLTENNARDSYLDWSPDGATIVYVSSGNGEDIWLMDSDGSNKRSLVSNAANDFVPCWSPDGEHVAFQTSYGNNDDEIAIVNVASGNVTRLTTSAGYDSAPAWKLFVQ